jgi:hypothetical protein
MTAVARSDGSQHHRICYYCGKKWCDVDPPSSKTRERLISQLSNQSAAAAASSSQTIDLTDSLLVFGHFDLFSSDKDEWQTNPRRCIWFLENQHPLFRTCDGFAALQDFHKWRLMR